jgi:hypothetical protein
MLDGVFGGVLGVFSNKEQGLQDDQSSHDPRIAEDHDASVQECAHHERHQIPQCHLSLLALSCCTEP